MPRKVSRGTPRLLSLSHDCRKMAALSAEHFVALQSLLKVSCRGVGMRSAAALDSGTLYKVSVGNKPALSRNTAPSQVLVCVTQKITAFLSF